MTHYIKYILIALIFTILVFLQNKQNSINVTNELYKQSQVHLIGISNDIYNSNNINNIPNKYYNLSIESLITIGKKNDALNLKLLGAALVFSTCLAFNESTKGNYIKVFDKRNMEDKKEKDFLIIGLNKLDKICSDFTSLKKQVEKSRI